MAKVIIRLLLLLQEKIGKKELHYEAETVGELLKKFLADYREDFEKINVLNENGQFKKWMLILLNGRNIRFLEGLNTKLNNNDVIAISPPMAGG